MIQQISRVHKTEQMVFFWHHTILAWPVQAFSPLAGLSYSGNNDVLERQGIIEGMKSTEVEENSGHLELYSFVFLCLHTAFCRILFSWHHCILVIRSQAISQSPTTLQTSQKRLNRKKHTDWQLLWIGATAVGWEEWWAFIAFWSMLTELVAKYGTSRSIAWLLTLKHHLAWVMLNFNAESWTGISNSQLKDRSGVEWFSTDLLTLHLLEPMTANKCQCS